jgi:hypothetical protein
MQLDDPAHANLTTQDPLKYAGFWLRFCSMFLDGLITTPLVLLIMLDTSRLVMIATVVFSLSLKCFTKSI